MDDRSLLGAFRDDAVGRFGIVGEDPAVADRPVFPEEIPQTGVVAPPDRVFHDVVPAGRHPCPYPGEGRFRRGQPQVQDRDRIPEFLGTAYRLEERTGRQGALDTEIRPFPEQVLHLDEHVTACLDGRGFRAGRGERLRELVRIDELAAFKQLGQDGIGCRRLARAVAAGDDEEPGHGRLRRRSLEPLHEGEHDQAGNDAEGHEDGPVHPQGHVVPEHGRDRAEVVADRRRREPEAHHEALVLGRRDLRDEGDAHRGKQQFGERQHEVGADQVGRDDRVGRHAGWRQRA